jgi:hypothetical protein
MFEERLEFGFRKKKKVDKSFSSKINFYKKPNEMPEVIEAKDLKKFIKKKPRLSRHNKKVFNDIAYDSGWEAEYAKKLQLKKDVGIIKDWKRQVVIEMNVIELNGHAILTDTTMLVLKKRGMPFSHICNYKIDFVVTNLDDSLEYIEIKGAEMSTWKLKYNIFRAMFEIVHPGIKLIIVR